MCRGSNCMRDKRCWQRLGYEQHKMLALLPARDSPKKATLGHRGQQEAPEEQKVTAGITPLLQMKEQERTQKSRPGEIFSTLYFLLQLSLRRRLGEEDHAKRQLCAGCACCHHPGRQFSIPPPQGALRVAPLDQGTSAPWHCKGCLLQGLPSSSSQHRDRVGSSAEGS